MATKFSNSKFSSKIKEALLNTNKNEVYKSSPVMLVL